MTPLGIECRYCHAPPGQPCHNKITNEQLHKNLTHPIRATDAKTIIPLPQPTPDDGEELF